MKCPHDIVCGAPLKTLNKKQFIYGQHRRKSGKFRKIPKSDLQISKDVIYYKRFPKENSIRSSSIIQMIE